MAFPARLRSLRAVLVATLLLAGLLPLVGAALVTEAGARRAASDADHAAAARLAGSTARELSRAFDEWAGELLVAAQNDALKGFYRDPARRAEYKTQIDASMVGLHTTNADLIDEACYIDATGPERARMVRGKAVGVGDLSPDESGNPFFEAAFAVSEGVVSQHAPYVSPDSETWVVSNATPVVVRGRKVAILHVETELEGVRRRIAALMPAGSAARVVDTGTGRLIFDTRTAVPEPDMTKDVSIEQLPDAGAFVVPPGRIGGSADVAVTAANGNRWRVEVLSPPAAGTGSAAGPLGLLALVVVVVLAVTAVLLGRRIVRPLQAITTRAERLAQGDLTGRLGIRRDDEIGRLAHAVDEATASLARTVQQIRAGSGHLAEVAVRVNAVGQTLNSTAAATDDESATVTRMASQVGSATADLEGTVATLDTSAGDLAARAVEAADVAGEGARTADETLALVGRLVEASETIDDVVSVIGSVTAQTRLLALNATIEAARAGDHGRGFAVVATEVKNLAEETQRATTQIAARVEALRTTAATAAEAVERITGTIGQVDRTQRAMGDALGQQSALTDSMRTGLRTLAVDAEAMTAGAGRVGEAAATTHRAVEESADSARRLAALAAQLAALVDTFVVDPAGPTAGQR